MDRLEELLQAFEQKKATRRTNLHKVITDAREDYPQWCRTNREALRLGPEDGLEPDPGTFEAALREYIDFIKPQWEQEDADMRGQWIHTPVAATTNLLDRGVALAVTVELFAVRVEHFGRLTLPIEVLS
jgi:hypothetical protein